MHRRDVHRSFLDAVKGPRPDRGPFTRLQAVIVDKEGLVTDELAGSFTTTRLLTWATANLKAEYDIDHQTEIYQRDFHSLVVADDGTQRIWFLARF